MDIIVSWEHYRKKCIFWRARGEGLRLGCQGFGSKEVRIGSDEGWLGSMGPG